MSTERAERFVRDVSRSFCDRRSRQRRRNRKTKRISRTVRFDPFVFGLKNAVVLFSGVREYRDAPPPSVVRRRAVIELLFV